MDRLQERDSLLPLHAALSLVPFTPRGLKHLAAGSNLPRGLRISGWTKKVWNFGAMYSVCWSSYSFGTVDLSLLGQIIGQTHRCSYKTTLLNSNILEHWKIDRPYFHRATVQAEKTENSLPLKMYLPLSLHPSQYFLLSTQTVFSVPCRESVRTDLSFPKDSRHLSGAHLNLLLTHFCRAERQGCPESALYLKEDASRYQPKSCFLVLSLENIINTHNRQLFIFFLSYSSMEFGY